MLVKVGKLLEIKRNLIRQVPQPPAVVSLSEMIICQIRTLNEEAERQNIITCRYPREYQEKYAQVVVDLEALNKQLGAYLTGIAEYDNSLLPHLSELTLTSRPDTLRKLCHSHALQVPFFLLPLL